MKRLLTILLITALLPVSAGALSLGDPLTGVYCWPEDAAADEASFVYSYCYPIVEGDDAAADMINNQYAYLVEDALAFFVPMTISNLSATEGQSSTVISHQVTCLNENNLSVLITTVHDFSGDVRTVISSHTFTLTGSMAGSATNLPRLIGLLDDDETDEWLLQRQTAKADEIVRRLLWRTIAKGSHESGAVFFDDLSEDDLEWLIYPEEDFYLSEDGQPVFYFQPGAVADEAYGPVFLTITLDMIDDEL